MEMPITRPSMVSYADEVNFSELLENLLKKRHNGFIRVTLASEEGYMLFKEGKQVAASYERHSRSDAVEMIKSVVEDRDTVVEVFDLRASYVDYIMEINKPYLMESDYDVYRVKKELSGSEITEPEVKPVQQTEPVPEVKETEKLQEEVEPSTAAKKEELPKKPLTTEKEESKEAVEAEEEIDIEGFKEKFDIADFEVKKVESEEEIDIEGFKEKFDIGNFEVKKVETEEAVVETEEAVVETEESKKVETQKFDINGLKEKFKIASLGDKRVEHGLGADTSSKDTKIIFEKSELSKETAKQNIQDESAEKTESKTVDRLELMKKYGIREIDEEDADDILESYKGGSLSDDDVERIELNLMNKIKKSIYGIPKVKGAEVMVFLDNLYELTGNVNIIIEYEPKGFISRLMGDYKDIEHLRLQVIDIVQIELKKSFRKYPKIIDNFDIKVEIA